MLMKFRIEETCTAVTAETKAGKGEGYLINKGLANHFFAVFSNPIMNLERK